MEPAPGAAERRVEKAADVGVAQLAQALGLEPANSDGPAPTQKYKDSLLAAALTEAQHARETWNASRDALRAEAKRLTKERKHVMMQKKAEERAKTRIRRKCSTIPTSELMLELEYRAELKAAVAARLDAGDHACGLRGPRA